jgi:hypothetical protein
LLIQIPPWLSQLYYLLTAPGVVIHELAHKHTAEDLGLAVVEYRLFQFGNPAGYVNHETPRTYRGILAVSAAPFLLNTMLALCLYLAIGISTYYTDLATLSHLQIALMVIGLWVALSSSLHAFPSAQDISNINTAAKRRWAKTPLGSRGLLGILTMPIFTLKHPSVVLSLPLVAVLVVLDRTRAIGSHFLFAGAVIATAAYALDNIYPFLATAI